MTAPLQQSIASCQIFPAVSIALRAVSCPAANVAHAEDGGGASSGCSRGRDMRPVLASLAPGPPLAFAHTHQHCAAAAARAPGPHARTRAPLPERSAASARPSPPARLAAGCTRQDQGLRELVAPQAPGPLPHSCRLTGRTGCLPPRQPSPFSQPRPLLPLGCARGTPVLAAAKISHQQTARESGEPETGMDEQPILEDTFPLCCGPLLENGDTSQGLTKEDGKDSAWGSGHKCLRGKWGPLQAHLFLVRLRVTARRLKRDTDGVDGCVDW
ncbi:uncharacterized protein LOC123792453 [Ursus americanus]|uniref:uncharacterized protein LOC123792453 n=1 Tax=Ursus americanus TaxID=9643 RepID=UPI001E67D542|nr:uncharacterized protein LOC123792453 [Ursus americanus]